MLNLVVALASASTAAALASAWAPLGPRCARLATPWALPRSSPLLARVVNSQSEDAQQFSGQSLSRADKGRPVAAPKKRRVNPDTPNLESPLETFNALCRMCGVPEEVDAELDFQGFVLAFEQLFNQNMQLEPESLDELRVAVCGPDVLEYEETDIGLTNWTAFHSKWIQERSMEAVLKVGVAKREAAKAAEQAAKALEAEKKRAEEAAEKREAQFTEALTKAKKAAREETRPVLLADAAKKSKKREGKWFEERENAAALAAQYRSLDPEKWDAVIDGVGGLTEPLEIIRRRIWVPLCAPRALLDELGAERVKGLLLYGPPGCGKSYLAARLAAGLSRRPPTLVSGPEVMDKYIGSSEAQLRMLFTSPPAVEPLPGDAPDTLMVKEANELHVIVLDEFDAIARRRGEGGGGNEAGSAARDSVVNQLLALMDGVADLPVPTFVLALTNRRELVDNAVLRPGRLEVQVTIGKPDESGRAAILGIHAEKMRESGRLALDDGSANEGEGCTLERVSDDSYASWLETIAAQTEGFSAAAMAAIVRAAVARALDRSVLSEDTSGCRVNNADFQSAIADLRSSSLELEEIEAEMQEKRDASPGGGENAEPQSKQKGV